MVSQKLECFTEQHQKEEKDNSAERSQRPALSTVESYPELFQNGQEPNVLVQCAICCLSTSLAKLDQPLSEPLRREGTYYFVKIQTYPVIERTLRSDSG